MKSLFKIMTSLLISFVVGVIIGCYSLDVAYICIQMKDRFQLVEKKIFMSEELRQAKEKVKWEVEYSLDQVEQMADRNDFERSWVLEEFKNQVVNAVNKKLR